MLPAIYFIFSRKGCDEAVKACLTNNIRLTTGEERAAIVEHADARVADLSTDELDALGYGEWLEGLSKGVAAHHAGMIPAFKETVEELFNRGLIKVVFATETLALGINMPARTVVIESLTKFTGETHELMTPGEYTQLAGRAGRRGIDELGHSVVLMQRFVGFDVISRLVSTRTYPLRSSFQPSYNMAVNLIRNYDREEAEHLVNSSFGQFQTDRHVVTLERNKEQLEGYLASYHDRMACHLGDVGEYRDLLQRLERMEQRHQGGRRRERGARIEAAMSSLRPGDVFVVPSGKRRGRYMVVRLTASRSKPARVTALSEERSVTRFAPADFREPPVAVARLKPPEGFSTKDARARRHLARMLSRLEVERGAPPAREEQDPKELKALRRAVERHPVRACPELGRHLHHADRAQRLSREIRSLDRRIARRTGTLARRFDLVVEILQQLGYVGDWTLTEKGETLTRVYNEADLLVVELLERGILEPLDPPELAALLSTLVFESRGGEEPGGELPTDPSRAAYSLLIDLWKAMRREEESRGLELTREPDPGFAERAFRWCEGAPLEEIVERDAPAGDFVRSSKQLVDLLRQLEEIAPSETLSRRIRAALEGLHRGVVAYSSFEF
jgi:ATP-dependent RNA helicase HelY